MRIVHLSTLFALATATSSALAANGTPGPVQATLDSGQLSLGGTIFDLTEVGCNDGEDDDGDGLIDYPNDPGCASPNDSSEGDPAEHIVGDITANGTVLYDGTMFVPAANLVFPDLPVESGDLVDTTLFLSISADTPATGTLDPESGQVDFTVDLSFEIDMNAAFAGVTCSVDVGAITLTGTGYNTLDGTFTNGGNGFVVNPAVCTGSDVFSNGFAALAVDAILGTLGGATPTTAATLNWTGLSTISGGPLQVPTPFTFNNTCGMGNPITLQGQATDLAPSRRMTLVYGTLGGQTTVPAIAGPCAGMLLPIGYAGNFNVPVNAAGEANVGPVQAPASICGQFGAIMLDSRTCTVTELGPVQ